MLHTHMRREPMAVKIKNSDIAIEKDWEREKKLISIALCFCNFISKDLAMDLNYRA